MDLETFRKLKKKAEEEIKFDPKNVESLCVDNSSLYQKYLDIYSTELLTLKQMKIMYDSRFGVAYKEVKYKDGYDWSKKGEVENQINTREDILELRNKMAVQEVIVEYLQNVLENIKKLSFSVKNYIDYKKVMMGMFG